MEYSWGTSLHDEDMEEFLRIKTPQWRHGGVLKEQTFLMEDMGNYIRKWREWRNTDFGNKSSTSIKGAYEDEEWTTNQPTNQSINQLNVNQQILAFNNFNKLSAISTSF